jgi:hypothetical protein
MDAAQTKHNRGLSLLPKCLSFHYFNDYYIYKKLSYLYYSLLLTSGEVKAAAPVLVCIKYLVHVSSSLKRLDTLKSINLTSRVPIESSVIITLFMLISLWQIETSSECRYSTISKSLEII